MIWSMFYFSRDFVGWRGYYGFLLSFVYISFFVCVWVNCMYLICVFFVILFGLYDCFLSMLVVFYGFALWLWFWARRAERFHVVLFYDAGKISNAAVSGTYHDYIVIRIGRVKVGGAIICCALDGVQAKDFLYSPFNFR